MLRAPLQSKLPSPWLGAIGVGPEGCVMSQLSKMKHSRDQWKEKATHELITLLRDDYSSLMGVLGALSDVSV